MKPQLSSMPTSSRKESHVAIGTKCFCPIPADRKGSLALPTKDTWIRKLFALDSLREDSVWELGMVTCTYSPSTQEDETGELSRVQCQLWLKCESPSQKKKVIYIIYILYIYIFVPFIIFFWNFKQLLSANIVVIISHLIFKYNYFF